MRRLSSTAALFSLLNKVLYGGAHIWRGLCWHISLIHYLPIKLSVLQYFLKLAKERNSSAHDFCCIKRRISSPGPFAILGRRRYTFRLRANMAKRPGDEVVNRLFYIYNAENTLIWLGYHCLRCVCNINGIFLDCSDLCKSKLLTLYTSFNDTERFGL